MKVWTELDGKELAIRITCATCQDCTPSAMLDRNIVCAKCLTVLRTDYNWKQMLEDAQELDSLNAVHLLKDQLINDESYFISWQANLAMAFKDNAAWFKKSHTGKRNTSNTDIHRIANRAADYFIEQLTGVKIENMKWNQNAEKR